MPQASCSRMVCARATWLRPTDQDSRLRQGWTTKHRHTQQRLHGQGHPLQQQVLRTPATMITAWEQPFFQVA